MIVRTQGNFAWPTQIISNKPSPGVVLLHLCMHQSRQPYMYNRTFKAICQEKKEKYLIPVAWPTQARSCTSLALGFLNSKEIFSFLHADTGTVPDGIECTMHARAWPLHYVTGSSHLSDERRTDTSTGTDGWFRACSPNTRSPRQILRLPTWWNGLRCACALENSTW
jgi:hypothetical protein